MEVKGDAHICPYCGYREGTPTPVPNYLPPGTVLAGKYLVGRGLGHGGFGNTYIAHDLVLGIKLAIKEYLPQDCAGRSPGQIPITPFTGEGEKRFRQGLESFLQEARILARFDGQPGIVGVRDFFTENDTAYLVMNYLEGITLRDVLVGSGAPMPYEKLLKIVLPVMSALERVHEAGLLHRDVSPDNIFLTRQGQVVLIDFGAARQSMGVQHSMSVILKPGYAPEEQYKSHGRQGPWTDIYALGACMYRALTCIIPTESLERLPIDTLKPPSALGIHIPPHAELALMRALAVHAQDRYQSIAAFRAALVGQQGPTPKPVAPIPGQNPPTVERRNGERRPVPPRVQPVPESRRGDPQAYPLKANTKKKKKSKAGIFVAVLLVLLLAALVIFGVIGLQSALGGGGFPVQDPGNLSTGIPSPTESQAPGAQETPAPQQPEEQPTQEPTGTPLPENMNATPNKEYVPKPYMYYTIDDGSVESSWFMGQSPKSKPEYLALGFMWNMQEMAPVGSVYIYQLDEQGNLIYGSADYNDFKIVMPANCTIGQVFNGLYGASEVVKVNHSVSLGGFTLENAVVLKTDAGYVYITPGVGVSLICWELDAGEPYYAVLNSAPADRALFETFITP